MTNLKFQFPYDFNQLTSVRILQIFMYSDRKIEIWKFWSKSDFLLSKIPIPRNTGIDSGISP